MHRGLALQLRGLFLNPVRNTVIKPRDSLIVTHSIAVDFAGSAFVQHVCIIGRVVYNLRSLITNQKRVFPRVETPCRSSGGRPSDRRFWEPNASFLFVSAWLLKFCEIFHLERQMTNNSIETLFAEEKKHFCTSQEWTTVAACFSMQLKTGFTVVYQWILKGLRNNFLTLISPVKCFVRRTTARFV